MITRLFLLFCLIGNSLALLAEEELIDSSAPFAVADPFGVSLGEGAFPDPEAVFGRTSVPNGDRANGDRVFRKTSVPNGDLNLEGAFGIGIESLFSVGAVSESDFFVNSQSSVTNGKEKNPLTIEKNSLYIDREPTSNLINSYMEIGNNEGNSFVAEAAEAQFNLFTAQKIDKPKVFSLWEDPEILIKDEASEMPWGWSLGSQANLSKPKKSGLFDW
ncbi:MAG: hypothetical protein EXR74_05355 [Bdellovibrionales bacterium]|nr:hypothetical protein [Bdellovibrionales bacterium]